MKKILNGEVFFILFLLSGFYKVEFMNYAPIDPTVLFFALSFFCVMIKLYKEPTLYKDMFTPVLLYGLISALMIFSLIFVGSNSYALSKTLSFVIITGWSFMSVSLLVNRNAPKQSLIRFLATFLFVGVLMIIGSFVTEQSDQLKFVSAFGSNYLALGKMSAITALISIVYLYTMKPKKIIKLILIALSVLSIYTMLQSGGRMPVLSFAVCLVVIILLGIRITGFDLTNITIKKKTIVYSFGGLIFSPFLIYYLYKNGNVFLSRFLLLFENDNSTVGRTDNFKTAIEMTENSNLMGMGIGSYHTYTGSFGDRSYPHNIFLEFSSELGIIGLVLFILLIGIALTRYFKYYFDRENFFSITILILFFYSLINAQVSGDFNDNRMLFFFIALLCMSKVFSKGSITHSEQTVQ